ncbi:MAG: M48 family metallopeptidase [Chloroflexi bacterium]|nr:M48 family metallopeptidase [Chloroflexota bacterium]
MPEITLGGQQVSYTVRESPRARTLRLKISPRAGLEVILPAGATGRDVEAILLSRAAWILKHLPAEAPPERRLVSGEKLPYLGRDRVLDIGVKPRGKTIGVMLDGDSLRVRLPAGTPATPETIRAALEGWYRAQAKAYLLPRTAELARQHGFRYGKITIKGQSTRWGSCSSQRNLNFNWRLMFAPPAAMDYVIIHELCHLQELNHSRRFWSLVARLCPDYKHWVKWFKANGDRLRL